MSSKVLDLFVEDKSYTKNDVSSHKVLDKIQLNLEKGVFNCLIGPSGCGKTTLLNIISSLDTDFTGKLTVADDCGFIAYVFQEPCLLPWKTVEQNLEFVMRKKNQARIYEILDTLQIGNFARSYPGELSLGMARRVSIGRALLFNPSVILLDEPFVSLDMDMVNVMQNLLVSLWRKFDLTVVLVTHDLRQALKLGTCLTFLSGSPTRITGTMNFTESYEERNDDWIEQQLKKIGSF